MGYPIRGSINQGYLQVARLDLKIYFILLLPSSFPLPFELLGDLLFHSQEGLSGATLHVPKCMVIICCHLWCRLIAHSQLLGAAISAGRVQHANRTQGELRMFRRKPFLAGGLSFWCPSLVEFYGTFHIRGWEYFHVPPISQS